MMIISILISELAFLSSGVCKTRRLSLWDKLLSELALKSKTPPKKDPL